MVYTERKELSYNELDFMGRWKPDNIFLTMQEAAGRHAERLGAGYGVLRQKGMRGSTPQPASFTAARQISSVSSASGTNCSS